MAVIVRSVRPHLICARGWASLLPMGQLYAQADAGNIRQVGKTATLRLKARHLT